MKNLTLDLIEHKKQQVVLLKFPYDSELGNAVRRIKSARWSFTNKAWTVPYSIENLKDVKNIFEPICKIDATLLKEKVKKIIATPKTKQLDKEALNKIEKFKDWMRSRRYSERTVRTYTDSLQVFLKYYHNKPVSDITNEDIIAFNNKYILANNFSSSYQNQVVNGIKLFFLKVENSKINISNVHRPKREKLLPNVLSKEEIKMILNAPSNIKHKCMLSLIYSCGLRRSELLNLKITEIDSKRKLLIIKQSKGKKDRIIPLSEKIIGMLRCYFRLYKPKNWLFEGQSGGKYSERSLTSVLNQTLEKTQIKKPVSLHWLRHSYATHLLEAGTDLRYIQEILGHNSSRTTEIYTHVSTKSIQNIKSPFDDLDIQ